MDPEALTKVVREVRPRLYAFMRSLGLAPADAEEIVQETFARMAAHPHYAHGPRPAAICFAIAKNLFRNRHRSSLTEVRALNELRLWGQSLGAQSAPDPHAALVQRGEVAQALAAAAALSPLDQEVLRMRVVGGLDTDSIGELCGLSPTAVRKRLSRLRSRLKKARDKPLSSLPKPPSPRPSGLMSKPGRDRSR